MSNTPPKPPGRPGGFLSEFEALIGASSPAEEPAGDKVLPNWDVPLAIPVEGVPASPDIPLAMPVPLAQPVVPLALPVTPEEEDIPLAMPFVPEAETPAQEPPLAEPEPVAEEAPPAPPAEAIICPACGSSNPISQPYCGDCGCYFSESDSATAPPAAATGVTAAALASGPAPRLQGRYELGERVAERSDVERYRALDHEAPGAPVPVVIVRQPLPLEVEAPAPESMSVEENDEILPSFDEPTAACFPKTDVMPGRPAWPSISWERMLLHTLDHPALPARLDHFIDNTHEYLVLEVPTGRSLWDAYDDPDADGQTKFGYLAEIAETLLRLHQSNAMLEELRPDIIVVGDDGRVHFTDLSDLLPLPLPLGAPIRGGPYTAPELLNGTGVADARADLYGFGAMLYALHVGRELNERTDFDGPGNPKPFIPRFPDAHPAFGRLMMKTFRQEVEARFPTDEASREDATGFLELIRTLEVLRRTHDNVRLEVASWTSTGIIRTGNEDAFAVLHAAESRQDDLGEAALVLLCDGMGGYEAGEVAAALTIQSLRQNLVQLRPFSVAAGASPFATDPQTQMSRPEGHAGPATDIDAVKQALKKALRDANKLVFQASRAPGSKRRGMGCTAEAVYIDGRNVIVGHVGDSRTYHLHEGRLVQLTRDQTLVNRLVELGTLSAEEAEKHPRRNELQQAIGGQPDVEPGVYHGKMSPGDWVIVCSDGLTNHVTARDLQQMLQSEALSAEMAARRLVNLTLIEGATDNVTVVAIRAT
jgi:serine/threonine protein phosphatase PrpC